jgi:hypothetical protein
MPQVSLESPPIAGVVVEIVSGAAGTMLLATGLLAGRLAFGALILVLDRVVG